MHDTQQIAAYAFSGLMIAALSIMAIYFLAIGLFEAGKNIVAKLNKETKQ